MGDYCVSIEKMSNGFEVEIKDPEIVKANQKAKSAYRDPTRSYMFKTTQEVLAFLKENLDKALPDDEYSSTFDAAVAADDKD